MKKEYLSNGISAGIVMGIIEACQLQTQEAISAGIPNAIAIEKTKKMYLEAMEATIRMIKNAPSGHLPEIKKFYPY